MKKNYEKIEEHRKKYVAPYVRRMGGTFLAGAELAGGHAMKVHIGKKESDMQERIDRDKIKLSSSFYNAMEAEKFVSAILEDEWNQLDIAEWLLNSEASGHLCLFLPEDYVAETGIVKFDGEKAKRTYDACVVLSKNSSECGWCIITAYPTVRK